MDAYTRNTVFSSSLTSLRNFVAGRVLHRIERLQSVPHGELPVVLESVLAGEKVLVAERSGITPQTNVQTARNKLKPKHFKHPSQTVASTQHVMLCLYKQVSDVSVAKSSGCATSAVALLSLSFSEG